MAEASERDAARVLMAGFGADHDAELPRLARLAPAGAILFARNLGSAAEIAALTGRLVELLPAPTLVALDQEGGRVNRLAPLLGALPTAERLAAEPIDATRRHAALTASALAALGFNLDFAPVVDLCPPTTPNGIGDRSFGPDPERVAACAAAFLAGLQSRGVAGCLKHFPGLGDTRVDSHVELPTVTRDRETLLRLDLAPYRRLAPAAAAVMVGHARYPALDGDQAPPATGSARVVSLLRTELGYDGLVVTDDLEMGAVADRDVDGALAVRAIEAGCDLLLYCSRLERAERARDALARRAREHAAFRARLADAAARVARFAAAWPLRRADPRACGQAVAEAASLRAALGLRADTTRLDPTAG